MQFELEPYHRNVPDQELIADVQRVASLLCKDTVTIQDLNDHGLFHAATLMRRFGNWTKTLQLAGLRVGHRVNIPEEELFEHIESVWVTLGRQPSVKDINASSKFGGNTYARRFGSWRKALEAFVVFINSEESKLERSSEEVLSEPNLKQRGTRDINWRLRFLVMRRDNFKCKACGRTPGTDPLVTLDVDHVRAWSKGGPTVLDNLQTLCTKCNIGKSDLDFLNSSPTEVQNVHP